MKGVEGKLAGAFLTTTPPTIKVMIRAPEEEWTGRDAIPEVVAIEGALRDATFYLYGRKTGPGYTVTVKPTRLEGLWLVTRLSVIPVGEQDRARFVQKLVVARDRARAALTKTGARVIDENTPTEAPTGQEVAAG